MTSLEHRLPVTAAVARAREGLAFRADTGEVVVPVVTREGTAVVRVGLLPGDLTEGVGRAWLVLGLLGLGMIALAVVVADRLGRSFVRPVGELAVTAERLGGGELEARVSALRARPKWSRLGWPSTSWRGGWRCCSPRSGSRSQTCRTGCGHRSPRLRLRAEAVDDPEAAAALLAQVDRLQREVDELIHSARRGSRSTSGVDLGLVARNRSDFWLVLADEQGRSFRIDLPTSPVIVEADVSEVAAVIDALVGNVFAHTPAGVGFDLVVRAEIGMAVLSVDDAGPGFPDRAVVRRGESRAGSTGLGLDIASRFAERNGGSLVAGSSPLGGARVEVRLVSQSPSPSPSVIASPRSPVA